MIGFKTDKLRLYYLESQIYWFGLVKRKDLAAFFKITASVASGTIREYVNNIAPGNIYYDPSAQAYKPSERFKPVIITPDAEEVLGHVLAQDGFLGQLPDMEQLPLPTRSLPATTLSAILTAIANSMSIRIQYQSMSTTKTQWRIITPHAFGNDGRRWHTRAYCQTKNSYKDFVLGRIIKIGEFEKQGEALPEDQEWHNMIELKICADKRLDEAGRLAIERDFCMEQGEATFTVRKALVYYALKHWNIGPDTRPHDDPRHQQIQLLDCCFCGFHGVPFKS